MMNRRNLLGGAGALCVLPAWSAPAPVPAAAEFAALIQVGAARSGAGNARWAPVLGGAISGGIHAGRVQAGRLDWRVDPASGAVEAALQCRIQCDDGRVREFSQRSLDARRAGEGLVQLGAFA